MLVTCVVQHGAIKFHPSMGLEAPGLFSSTNAQICADAAPVKEPPERQGPLEAGRAEKEMPRRRLLEASDLTRGIEQCAAGLTARNCRARHEPRERGFPALESGKAQAKPGGRERHSGLQNESSRVSAETPEAAPRFNFWLQAFPSKKVARPIRKSSPGRAERILTEMNGTMRGLFSTTSASRRAAHLNQPLVQHLFEQAEQVAFTTVRVHLVLGEQGIAELADGLRLLQQIPDARANRV